MLVVLSVISTASTALAFNDDPPAASDPSAEWGEAELSASALVDLLGPEGTEALVDAFLAAAGDPGATSGLTPEQLTDVLVAGDPSLEPWADELDPQALVDAIGVADEAPPIPVDGDQDALLGAIVVAAAAADVDPNVLLQALLGAQAQVPGNAPLPAVPADGDDFDFLRGQVAAIAPLGIGADAIDAVSAVIEMIIQYIRARPYLTGCVAGAFAVLVPDALIGLRTTIDMMNLGVGFRDAARNMVGYFGRALLIRLGLVGRGGPHFLVGLAASMLIGCAVGTAIVGFSRGILWLFGIDPDGPPRRQVVDIDPDDNGLDDLRLVMAHMYGPEVAFFFLGPPGRR